MLGSGCFSDLGKVLASYASSNVFLVTGKTSFKASGASEVVDALKNMYRFTHFDAFTENPKFEDAVAGAAIFRSDTFDTILAVGGGTALDMAKLIKAFAPEDADPAAIVSRQTQASPAAVKLIACPTTSGTGSESTHFAVVYKNHEKYSIAHRDLLPDLALIDASLTDSVPSKIAASAGLDALCQAIESLWSIHATETSSAFARQAIKGIIENLQSSIVAPDHENRLAMSRCANLAGKAIDMTKTTAPHALSYYLTSHHGIRHGHAVALMLPLVFHYNLGIGASDCHHVKGPDYVLERLREIALLIGCDSQEEFGGRFQALVGSLGLSSKLQQLECYNEQTIKAIAEGVNTERLANNPRAITTEDLIRILSA